MNTHSPSYFQFTAPTNSNFLEDIHAIIKVSLNRKNDTIPTSISMGSAISPDYYKPTDRAKNQHTALYCSGFTISNS